MMMLMLAAQNTPPKPAYPAELQNGTISMIDYPADAKQKHEQGRSVVKFDVGKDGVPRNCTVAVSSGSTSLDTATCDIILSRFRYTIPRDDKGNPVIEHKEQGVTWSLGLPSTELADGNHEYTSTVVLHYDADGKVVSCDTGTGSTTVQQICDTAESLAKGRKMTFNGQPTADEYRIIMTTIVTPE